jgi:hypothetical protein
VDDIRRVASEILREENSNTLYYEAEKSQPGSETI